MSGESPRLNPHIANAPVYTAGTRAEDVARRYGVEHVVKLASNESPLGPSPKAMEAISAAIAGLHRYPPVADDELRERIACRLGIGITPDHVACGNGGSDVLGMIAQGFLDVGDEAIICPPTFPLYEILIRRRGARPVLCDLVRSGAGYCYDVGSIVGKVTHATRIIFICSPVNPTGTTISRKDLHELLRGVPGRVVVVFDESYRDFAERGTNADPIEHVQKGRPVIAVRSFSKSHGLAGLRVGYAIARPDLAEYLRRLRVPFQMGSLAIAGALAALDDDEHVERTRALVQAERQWLLAELSRRTLDPLASQANFLVFRPGFDPEVVYERLLRRGVVVRPAKAFYMPEHIRVSTGTRAENERFVAALDEVLAELAREAGR